MDSDGSRFTNHLFSVGSGSTYAYGVLDSEHRWDMTTEEARELGKRAIYHATHRDAYSGGVVNCKFVLVLKVYVHQQASHTYACTSSLHLALKRV